MENHHAPLIRILLPFCIGIWVLSGTHFTELNSVLTILTLSIFILLFIINVLYAPLKVYHHKIIIAILIYLFFFCLGGLWYLRYTDINNSSHFSHTKASYLMISIADEPQLRGSVLRFKARVWYRYAAQKRQRATGYLLVAVFLDAPHLAALKYGDTYLIPANYQPVEPPYNPGEFDFRSWLASQNIYHQTFLRLNELIPLGQHKGSPLISFALSLRQQQIQVYRKLIKDKEAFAVASTLILGYRADLDAETLSAYSKTGTIHALSVSGMHVGIIYVVLDLALKWMNRKRVLKWVKLLLLLSAIWFYTLLTGYSASVLRSALMLSLFIISRHAHKNAGSYHILAISAFCLLLYNPFLLWDPGCQLSYLAVYGLIWLAPKIQLLMVFKHSWLQKLWGMISISIAAQILTFPFSSYYFHQFPVYFILSNLFIALPVALLMYSGLAILLFHFYWLAPAFEWLIIFMNSGLQQIAHLPYSGITGIDLNKMELTLLCMSLFCACADLSGKTKPLVFAALLFLLCLQGVMAHDKIRAMQQKTMILFRLKKHYATAFISGTKAIVITDLPKDAKAFKFHVQPALNQLKIRNITCITWNRSWSYGHFTLKDHQIHFWDDRILLIDTSFNHQKIIGKPAFDVVWLHGISKAKSEELKKEISFKRIWIDAWRKPYK